MVCGKARRGRLQGYSYEATGKEHDKADDGCKAELDELMNTMLSRCVSGGYLKEEDSKRLVSVFMDNLRNFKELKNPDVFPSQLCFNIVITVLGGLCTQRGKKVLDELKDNYN